MLLAQFPLKLTAITAVAVVGTLSTAPAPALSTDDVDVVHAAAATPAVVAASVETDWLSFAGFVDTMRDRRPLPANFVSEEEAVQIALTRGAEIRRARMDERVPLRGDPSVAAPVTEAEDIAASPLFDAWQVTGSVVNVRAEPTTSAPVLTQVRRGQDVAITGDIDGNWVELSLPDHGTVWIHRAYIADPATL